MDRVEDQRASLKGPRVGCNHLAGRDDDHSVDEALDRHHLECERARNAVPIAIEGSGLVLVHRGGRTNHTSIKAHIGNMRCRSLFFGEAINPS